VTTSRWTWALVAGSAWTLALASPWPDALGGWPWLRVLIALLLFSVPGFCLHALLDPRRELDATTRLPGGLTLSVAVTGLLGFTGSVLGLPTGFVTGGLFAVGWVGIVLLARRGGVVVKRPARPDSDALLDAAALGVALLVTGWLCIAPVLGSDDLTHVARVTAFQQRSHLGFGGIAFGGDNVIAPRYWLAFWPLCEAILSSLASVQPLELTTNHLGGLLGVAAGLAVFGLARTLGLTRRLAVVAVIAQSAGLLLMAARDQPGVLFFNRVTEDKFVAFFVLAPAVLQTIAAHFGRPSRGSLARVALAWSALVFSHATSLGMVALVAGGFCALELLFGTRREAALVLALIVPLTGAAAMVRFVPHVYLDRVYFDVQSAAEDQEVTAGRKRRIAVVRGTRFYGIGPAAVGATGRVLGATVLLVALACAPRRRDARYVAAALGTVTIGVVPYTGWILGALLTPFHLWRMVSLAPFGIGTAFLLALAGDALGARATALPGGVRRTGRVALGSGLALLLVLVAAGVGSGSRLTAFARPGRWQDALVLHARKRNFHYRLPYPELAELSRVLRDATAGGAVLIADRGLNDLVPSLTADARLLVFRSGAQSALHAGIPLADARRLWDEQSRVVGGETAPQEVAAFLARNRVELVLTTASAKSWLAAVPPDLVPRTRVASVAGLDLYRLGTGSGARPRTS